jgi:hypothetical protein
MIQKPYVPVLKAKGFNPSPVAGNIPIWADGKINPRVQETQRYRDFWDEQFDRSINGYDTGGIHIPGRYYFYLNFVVLQGLRGPSYPMYVDLDLEYYNLVEYVKKNQKTGIVSVKARRKGLSEKAENILSHGIRFIEGYRGAIAAGLDTYQIGLRKKFDAAQAKFHDELRLNVLKDNDSMYHIGYERKDPIGGYVDDGYGGRLSFATLFDDPKKLEGEYFHDVVFEESGQFKLLGEAFESIKPALEFGILMLGTFYIYGCVCAGTKVWDNKGNLINIEDLKSENGILGFNGTGISKEQITYWQPPKEKPCYRITTFSGRTLECSEDHPILWSNKGFMRGPHKSKLKGTRFVETKNLKIGDQVATIESVPIFGENKTWEPRLIGWLIGDGSYGFDKTPVLSNCDNEINTYIQTKLDCKVESERITKDNKVYYETRIRGVCKRLRDIGIYGQTRNNKTLPVNIHSWRKKDICELLGGLFDTDGHVNEFGKNLETITLTSSSKNLLFEVKLLFQKLGIHCNISRIKCILGEDRKDRNDCYRLNISSARDIIKFGEEINFLIKYKQTKLVRICNRMPLRNKRIKKGVTGLRFERITNIEFLGNKPVYNLTAGTTNTYIANGIVTHNTGGNILSTSKDFKDFWDNAETYGLEKFWVPGTRLYYPFFGNPFDEFFIDKDNNKKIDAIPNLRELKPFQRIGCEDIKAAEEYIIEKRIEYAKLPNKKKLKEHNQNYPLTVEEAFTSGGSNNFDDDKIYSQLFTIEGNIGNYKPVVLEWVYDIDAGVKKIREPLQVEARPAKKGDPDGEVIWVYQYPRTDMTDLDIGGIDGYNQDKTQTSKSLGSMVVTRQGDKVNLVGEGIHNAKYPVCLYYKRPARKEIFFENCLKISVWYNLLKNTMCNAEQDFVIDYYIKNGGKKFLSPRPKAFDSPKSEQRHKFGAKMTGYSKPLILGVVQSWVEDFVQFCFFVEMLRDLLAYDEEYIGTDWDSVDALAYSIMRIEDMRTRPRKGEGLSDAAYAEAKWRFDENGNAILVSVPQIETKKEISRTLEGHGGWKPGDGIDRSELIEEE